MKFPLQALWLCHILLFLILCTACDSPNGTDAAAPEEVSTPDTAHAGEQPKDTAEAGLYTFPKDIEAIQGRYADITAARKANALEESQFRFNCRDERTGEVRFYRRDGQIVLIEKVFGEYSHREVQEQYYLAEGKPFFIFIKTLDWVFDEGGTADKPATRDNIKEERYYIAESGNLLRCLQKEYIIRSASTQNPDPAEVDNAEVACPSANSLHDRVKALLKYKDQQKDVECL